MVAYSFKPRFVEPIIAGTKGGTVRVPRTHRKHAKPGDALQLYVGMRTASCRLIAEKPCVEVEKIGLHIGGGMVQFGATGAGRIFTTPTSLDRFAEFDGFRDWGELVEFFVGMQRRHYFEGVHIRWLPLPKDLA